MPNPESVRIAQNVFLDPNSGHGWGELVQREFLAELFAALDDRLAPGQRDVRFYLFSPISSADRPASASFPDRRKALIWLSDEENAVDPRELSLRYLAIFKPSMTVGRIGTNIHTMSLGFANGVPTLPAQPMAERDLDLFFSGNLNRNRYPLYLAFHPWFKWLRRIVGDATFHAMMRSPLGRFSRRDFGDGPGGRRIVAFTDGFGRGLSRDEYGRILADARIVLAPRGFVSAETFRHQEALRAGAVVVSDRLPDTFLYRGSPFQCVDDWEEGMQTVAELLSDPARLQALQEAGLRWYEEVLSPEAEASRIAQVLADVDV